MTEPGAGINFTVRCHMERSRFYENMVNRGKQVFIPGSVLHEAGKVTMKG